MKRGANRIVTLDLPLWLVKELDNSQIKQRQRGGCLRSLLRDAICRYYDFKKNKPARRIVVSDYVFRDEDVCVKIGLPIPEEDIVVVDAICNKYRLFARKNLVEFFIVDEYLRKQQKNFSVVRTVSEGEEELCQKPIINAGGD